MVFLYNKYVFFYGQLITYQRINIYINIEKLQFIVHYKHNYNLETIVPTMIVLLFLFSRTSIINYGIA